jgi:hypothetical protein
MTGSTVAIAVIPIVTSLALFAWLALVFNAAAHPPSRKRDQAQAASRLHGAGSRPERSGAHQEQAEEPPRTERRAA